MADITGVITPQTVHQVASELARLLVGRFVLVTNQDVDPDLRRPSFDEEPFLVGTVEPQTQTDGTEVVHLSMSNPRPSRLGLNLYPDKEVIQKADQTEILIWWQGKKQRLLKIDIRP